MAQCDRSWGNCACACRRVWVRILVFAGVFGLAASATAQGNANWPKARPADVRSVSSMVRSTYDGISGTKRHGPDLKRFQSLFTPAAQLVDVTCRNEKSAMVVRTAEQFVDAVAKLRTQPGRCEREIVRRKLTYGSLVQVWNTNEYGMYANNSAPNDCPVHARLSNFAFSKTDDQDARR